MAGPAMPQYPPSASMRPMCSRLRAVISCENKEEVCCQWQYEREKGKPSIEGHFYGTVAIVC